VCGIEISEEAAKFGNATSAKISLLQEPDELAQGVFALLDGARRMLANRAVKEPIFDVARQFHDRKCVFENREGWPCFFNLPSTISLEELPRR